ncbi:chitinase [Trichoderma evansii]
MKILLTFTLLLSALVQLSVQQDGECSDTKLCPEGCCSSAGHCGYGPDYCGKGCQSTCDRKSGCNPGWESNDFSKGDKCPLNVCCSKHGFCGYTEEFCKGNEVKRPSCSISDTPVDRVIGYYEGWATSNRRCNALRPEEIPYGAYTHLIFSFATINPKLFEIWVAFGGWAFNDPGPTQTIFSDVAASEANTETFLSSLVKLMDKFNFDGVDIDWEYPVAADRHGRDEDYENIVTFMKKLRARMDKYRRGVSMALPASYWYLQHFDIWTGPWANSHTNLTDIQLGLDLLWRNKISPSKVTMGMSYYARTFTLTDPGCNKPGCRVSSPGEAGKCSGTAGVLLHPEIQDIISKNNLKPVLDREAAIKAVSWGNQSTSFDDAATWRLKANKLRGQCITGFMVWAISHDDEFGTNAEALASVLGRKKPDFPNFTIRPKVEDSPDLESKTCRWTSCFEGCPSGFKEVQRDGHKEIMLDTTPCFGKGYGFSRLCCPTSAKSPTCTWRGHRNTGKCKPGCNDFELEVGSLSVGCRSGYQSACCSDTLVTSLYSKCVWTGCTSQGKNACTGNNPHFLTSSSVGSGGACSSNQLMMARESGLIIGSEGGDGCYGDLAFCCTESEKLKPRDEDPGSSQGREFQALIRKYMENPIYTWVRLLQYATLVFSVSRAGMDPLIKVWDKEFAGNYDKQLEYNNLHAFLLKYKDYEPRSVVEWVLYNPTRAGPGIRGADAASQALCRVPGSKARSIPESTISNIDSRKIDAWGGGSQNGNVPGPMLEMAYWLGRQPGHENSEDISEYQDQTPRPRWPSDRWVLFHLHIDPSNRNWLISENGNTYVGVSNFRVMHSQYWMHGRNGQAWRVSHSNGIYNSRDGFSCLEELGSLWYVRSRITLPDDQPEWARLLHQWGEMIYRQGYVGNRGLRMIIEPPQGGSRTEVNPHNPGELSRGVMGTSVVGGNNPYEINFILSDEGYEFTTPPPPQDREDPDTPA